jgi:uncharacterized membrane protein
MTPWIVCVFLKLLSAITAILFALKKKHLKTGLPRIACMGRNHWTLGCALVLVLLIFFTSIPAIKGQVPADNVTDDIFTSTPEYATVSPPSIPGTVPLGNSAGGIQKTTSPETVAGSDLTSGLAADIPVSGVQLVLINGRGEQVRNVHVLVSFGNSNVTTRTLVYIGENGRLDFALDHGTWTIIVRADAIDTPGADYYGMKELTVRGVKNETITLSPVGSLRGVVMKDHTLVPNARVGFDCSGIYGEAATTKTDQFGQFSSQWLPLGTCKVSASEGALVGTVNVDIVQGALQDVTIPLETSVDSGSSFIILLSIVGCALLLLIFIVLFHRRRLKKKDPARNQVSHTSTVKSRRLDDVKIVLSKKERDIIDLLKKDGEVTQAKIIYSLMIPKTTLVRLLQNLEAKQVIEIKKYGKAKKIALTDWILEKK